MSWLRFFDSRSWRDGEPPTANSIVKNMLQNVKAKFPEKNRTYIMSAFAEYRDSNIRRLEGEDAQIALDIMQTVTIATHFEDDQLSILQALNSKRDVIQDGEPTDPAREARRLLRKRIHGLSRHSRKLPSCFTLKPEDAKHFDTVPPVIGGYTDVYRGSFKDKNVVFKYIRVAEAVDIRRASNNYTTTSQQSDTHS